MIRPSSPDPDDYQMTPLIDQARHQVIEVMMSTVISVLRRMINEGDNTEARCWVGRMANAWPLVSPQAATVARQDPSYAVMVYYERVRCGKVQLDYFFDGMPSRVIAFGAPIKLELPAQQMSQLLYNDVVADRATTVEKVENAGPDSARRRKLAETLDGLSDVSNNVPLPVRLFLSRMRSMCHGLRASQPEARFRQCGNNQCKRLFYIGEGVSSQHVMRPSDKSGLCNPYWEQCSPLPLYNGPNTYRFCSEICACQWQNDWYRMMPERDDLNWADVLNPRKASSSKTDVRVHQAFDSAIERNRAVSHTIAKRRKKLKRSGSAITKVDFNREVDARVEMLNIDAGILYAATIFTRLPNRRASLALPGDRIDWRAQACDRNRNALIRVAQIYRQHQQTCPIHELLDTPAFFRALKFRVTTIFE